jgi:hypothetical protein
MGKWINPYGPHTMEYYSAWKGEKILLHATTWMNLEATALSEIS